MPITPFHFGPGAVLNSVAPNQVSFLTFCSANVLIDTEPLYYICTKQYPLHRFFHTYIGASVVMVVIVIIFLASLYLASKVKLPNIFNWQNLTSLPIWLGAATGSYSHIVLDSVMHPDIFPLSPFSENNVLFHIIPLGQLHLFCLFSGFLALVILGFRRLTKAKNEE